MYECWTVSSRVLGNLFWRTTDFLVVDRVDLAPYDQ